MKCIVINLERSIDRRRLITEQFDSAGVEFEISKAKDRLDLSELDYEKYANRESNLMNWKHSSVPGALACWISHQQVWRACLEDETLDMVAIFEDDAFFEENFGRALNALESTDRSFDIVFLENRYPQKPFSPLIEIGDGFSLGLVKYGNMRAMGYVITRRAMQRLIDRFPRMTVQVDVIVHAPWLSDLVTYTLDPPVARHRSDLESCIQVSGNKQRKPILQVVRDLMFVSIPKRFKLSIPERICDYRCVMGR